MYIRSVSDIKIDIANLVNKFKLDSKKRIDYSIFFRGLTKTAKRKRMNTADFDKFYRSKYNTSYEKELILQDIINDLVQDDVLPGLRILIAQYILSKLPKTSERRAFVMRELKNDRRFWNELKNELNNNPVIKTMNDIQSERDYVNINDREKIMKDFNLSDKDFRQIINQNDIKYLTKIQEKKYLSIKEMEQKVDEIKNNGGVLFKDKYYICPNGEMYKVINAKVKKLSVYRGYNNMGSVLIRITLDSKQYYVHKLIAELFVPNSNNYKYVTFKDGNHDNYNSYNLQWIEYPAMKRIENSLKSDDVSWLNFIIENFIDGVNITDLSEELAVKAEKAGIYAENKNKAQTVYTTITNYSQKNKNHPVFMIRPDLQYTVFLNKEIINKFKRRENE